MSGDDPRIINNLIFLNDNLAKLTRAINASTASVKEFAVTCEKVRKAMTCPDCGASLLDEDHSGARCGVKS